MGLLDLQWFYRNDDANYVFKVLSTRSWKDLFYVCRNQTIPVVLSKTKKAKSIGKLVDIATTWVQASKRLHKGVEASMANSEKGAEMKRIF